MIKTPEPTPQPDEPVRMPARSPEPPLEPGSLDREDAMPQHCCVDGRRVGPRMSASSEPYFPGHRFQRWSDFEYNGPVAVDTLVEAGVLDEQDVEALLAIDATINTRHEYNQEGAIEYLTLIYQTLGADAENFISKTLQKAVDLGVISEEIGAEIAASENFSSKLILIAKLDASCLEIENEQQVNLESSRQSEYLVESAQRDFARFMDRHRDIIAFESLRWQQFF